MKKWKLGVSSADANTSDAIPATAPILLTDDILSNLATAAELGYQAIEVHTRESALLDLDAIKEQMDKTGVRICQVITGRLNTEGHCDLISDEPYITDAAIEGMLKYVDMAAYLDADLVLGWAKGKVPAGGNRDRYMGRLAYNLKVVNDYAADNNVRINIEVINHYETNVFTTVKELADFLDAHPELTQCYIHMDTYHMQLEEEDYEAAFTAAADKIGYFHVADSSRWYPGSGNMDIKRILELLEKSGYDGYVTVECFPKGDGKETAKKAIEYMNSLMNS